MIFLFFEVVLNHLVDEGVNKVSKNSLVGLFFNIILVMKSIG